MLTVKKLKDYLNSLDETHDDLDILLDNVNYCYTLVSLPSNLRKIKYGVGEDQYMYIRFEDESGKEAILISHRELK